MFRIEIIFLTVASVTLVVSCPAGRQMLRSGGLTIYERQAIVDAHNQLRQSVALGRITRQPPAANMMEMVWDEELAATAQRWADQCTTAHDGASQRDVGRFPVGQNIAATWTTRRPSSAADSQPDFNKQINAWFDEVQLYGFKPIGYSHGTGHYSQLVWGETSHVGCGYSFFYDPSRGYTKLYVCNYGPGGNVIGSNPYEKGHPSCGSFGLSESPKYSGLCSTSYSGGSYSPLPIENNYASNAIPDSTGDAQSGYNSFAFNSYKQFSNQYQYQNSYNHQRQNSYKEQPNTYRQDQSYNQQPHYYQTTEAVTYKPFISLFKGASDIFSNAKENIFTPKRTGFRFGTLYLS